jgi:putative tricarboxylic transport membrane protein
MAAGVFLALLGLLTFFASTQIAEGAGGQLHPRTFPLLLGVLLFIGGLLLTLRAYASGRGADQIVQWPDRRGEKYWVIALLSIAAYIGFSPLLGFLLSTFLFVAGFIWYFGRYKPALAMAYALGTVLFVYFLFVRLLQLTLPLGPLSFL